MTRCPDDCQYGDCNNQYPFQCICYDSALKGHWGGSDHGGPCQDCKAGYYGPRCTFVCPGGTCQTCGGHGICNDGRNGNGQCQCFAEPSRGYWGGQGCTRCADLHYGSECKGVCGCSSHGTCEQGIAGNGTCFCDYGWKGQACGDCDQKIIPGCKSVLKCPGDPLPCTGNGNCTRPTAGSLIGVCTCNEFFGTEDCSVECPGHCNGHGLCQDGATRDGTCLCANGFLLPGCGTCQPDRWGPLCQSQCPGAGIGKVCNNSGTCRASDGRCDCGQDFSGTDCLFPCPRYNGAVCNSHGLCDADAACQCFSNASHGFWTDALCTTCVTGYAGPECTIACPQYNNQICSGHGNCLANNGTCDCTPPFCGSACVVKFNTTTGRCQSCPEQGQYGENCTQMCQCVHGDCEDGRAGDGSCTCEPGWSGPLCDTPCPGGTTNPCGGPARGTCIPAKSECDCKSGFAGDACQLQCPDATCNNHGTCNDTNKGDGTCTCNVGWVWPSTGCNQQCDCSGHGTCPVGNLTCECHLGFTGGRCDRCVDGLGGGACNATCVHGITEGLNCKCDDGWGGAVCDVACPLQNGKVCNDQGTCGADGECSCNNGWVGPRCECHDTECENRIGPAVCNATTGQCICAPGRAGLAGGCQDCIVGLWGPDCGDTCDCSQRGSCNKLTGACSCFGNDAIGYWAGSKCDICATGYMGAVCRQKSIAVTVLTSLLTRTQTVQRNFFCHLDTGRRVLFCGGQGATAVFNVSTTIPNVIGMSTVQATCGNGGGDLFAVFPAPGGPPAASPNSGSGSGSGSASTSSGSGAAAAAATEHTAYRTMQQATTHAEKDLVSTNRGPMMTVNDRDVSGLHGVVDGRGGQQRRRREVRPLAAASPSSSSSAASVHSTAAATSRSSSSSSAVASGSNTTPSSSPSSSSRAAASSTAAASSSGRSGSAEVARSSAAHGSSSGGSGGGSLVVGPSSSSSSGARGSISAMSSSSNMASSSGTHHHGGSSNNDTDSSDSSSNGGATTPAPAAGPTPTDNNGIFTGPDVWPYNYFYLMQLNTTCTTTNVQLWKGSSKYFFEDRDIIIRNVIDSTPQYLDMAEHVAVFDTVCVIPSKAREVYCKAPTSPIAQVGLLDIVRASSMKQFKKDGTLIISGNYASQCQIIKVNGSTAQAFASADQSMSIKTDMQRVGIQCQSVDCTFLDEPSRTLYFAASSPTGSYVGAYHIDTGVLVEGGLFTAPTAAKCTAIVHDSESKMGLAVFGSTMVKFRPKLTNGTATLSAYGQQALASPLIRDLVLFQERQVVYGPLLSTRGTSVFRFLLVEVESIEPVVADRAGGAVITLRGSGFRNLSTTVCRFDVSDVVPAVFVSPNEIHCVAPLAQSGDTCLLQPVEASTDGLAFTANKNELDRPVAAVVSKITPRRVPLADVISRTVRKIEVHGTGFIDSKSAMCKIIVNPSLPVSDPLREVRLQYTYKLPTLVECEIPVGFAQPTEPASVVAVSLDGQVFGTVTSPFSIVGSAAALSVTPNVITRGSAITVTFTNPSLAVKAIDVKGNLLESFDTDGRRLKIVPGGAVGSGTGELNGTLEYTMASGEALLDGIFMSSPNVATLRFFVDAITEGWRTDFTIVITSGALFSMRMVQSPIPNLGTLVPNALLPQVAEVATIDAAGNVVGVQVGQPQVTINVTLRQINRNDHSLTIANTTALFAELTVKDTGQATLDQLPLPLVFGPLYVMSFLVASDPTIVVSTRPFEAGCAVGQFFVDGEASCRECDPNQAHCNGTAAVILKPGYWRASSQSLTIYQCPTTSACTGNAPFGGCEFGYRGPLCDVCAVNWGKDFTNTCEECPPLFLSLLVTLLLLGVYIAIATGLLIVIVQNWEITTTRVVDTVIVLTMTFTFLQNVSLTQFFTYKWVSFNQQLFSGLGTAADLRFASVRPIYCLFRDIGLTNQHLPALYAALFGLIPIVQTIARGLLLKFPNLGRSEEATARREDLLAQMRQLRAQGHTELALADETPVEHDMKPTLLVSSQLIVFFLIQPGLFYALETLFCKDISIGNDVSLSVLRNDFSVSCDTDQYNTVKIVCIVLLLLYMIVPAALWMTILFFQSKYKDTFYKLYSAFLTIGLRDEVWYWHIAGLGKKIVMVFAVVVPSEPVDMYLFCWVTMLFTFLVFYLDPYVERKHNRIELALHFCNMLTANAAMSIRVLDIDAIVNTFSALVMVMNCCVYVFLAYDLCYVWIVTSYRKFKHSRRQFDGGVEEDETTADGSTNNANGAYDADNAEMDGRRRRRKSEASLPPSRRDSGAVDGFDGIADAVSMARGLFSKALDKAKEKTKRTRTAKSKGKKNGAGTDADADVVSSALEEEMLSVGAADNGQVKDPFASVAALRRQHQGSRAVPRHNSRHHLRRDDSNANEELASPPSLPLSPGLMTPRSGESGILSSPSQFSDESGAIDFTGPPAISAIEDSTSANSNDNPHGDDETTQLHRSESSAARAALAKMEPGSPEFAKMQREIETFFLKGVGKNSTLMREAGKRAAKKESSESDDFKDFSPHATAGSTGHLSPKTSAVGAAVPGHAKSSTLPRKNYQDIGPASRRGTSRSVPGAASLSPQHQHQVPHHNRAPGGRPSVVTGATGVLDTGAGDFKDDPWGDDVESVGGSDVMSVLDPSSFAHPNNRRFPVRRGDGGVDDDFDFDNIEAGQESGARSVFSPGVDDGMVGLPQPRQSYVVEMSPPPGGVARVSSAHQHQHQQQHRVPSQQHLQMQQQLQQHQDSKLRDQQARSSRRSGRWSSAGALSGDDFGPHVEAVGDDDDDDDVGGRSDDEWEAQLEKDRVAERSRQQRVHSVLPKPRRGPVRPAAVHERLTSPRPSTHGGTEGIASPSGGPMSPHDSTVAAAAAGPAGLMFAAARPKIQKGETLYDDL